MPDPTFEISSASSITGIPAGHPTDDEKSEANACADSIKYEHIWQAGTTLQKKKTVRLQNLGAGKIEVQLLASKNAPIARVLVQSKIKEAFSTPEGAKFHPIIRKAIADALKKSIASHNAQSVNVKIPPLQPPQYTVSSQPISPYPKPPHPTSAAIADALKCIAALTYDKIFTKEGDILKQPAVRLDAQKATPQFRNLQIQINNIDRPSTIAQVLVDTALNEKYSTTEGAKFHDQIKTTVANALKKSLQDRNSYTITLKT